MRPATTLFVYHMKKNSLKQPLEKTLPSNEMGNKHKAAMHKKRL